MMKINAIGAEQNAILIESLIKNRSSFSLFQSFYNFLCKC